MIVTREKITQDIATLSDFQLRQVAEYLDFLKFKEKSAKHNFDESEIAKLYQGFETEDRELAESDLADYAENLKFEDMK